MRDDQKDVMVWRALEAAVLLRILEGAKAAFNTGVNRASVMSHNQRQTTMAEVLNFLYDDAWLNMKRGLTDSYLAQFLFGGSFGAQPVSNNGSGRQ